MVLFLSSHAKRNTNASKAQIKNFNNKTAIMGKNTK